MKSLAIIEPIRPTAISSASTSATDTRNATGVENLLTPDPKEVIEFPSDAPEIAISIDLGKSYSLDTILFGYITPQHGTYAHTGDGPRWRITAGVAAHDEVEIVPLGNPFGTTPASSIEPVERHALATLAAAASYRFLKIYFRSLHNAPVTVGVLGIGKAFKTQWGHEWGAGRPIEDTSSVERLFGGGFGIEPGVTAGGYQWTFGDLTDEETQELYQIKRRNGIRRTILVVEDPEASVGLNERIHWGLFERLETYERLLPGATRWSLKIRDWA